METVYLEGSNNFIKLSEKYECRTCKNIASFNNIELKYCAICFSKWLQENFPLSPIEEDNK